MRIRYMKEHHDGRVTFYNWDDDTFNDSNKSNTNIVLSDDKNQQVVSDTIYLYPESTEEKSLWPYSFSYERNDRLNKYDNTMLVDRFILFYIVSGRALFNGTPIKKGDVFIFYPGIQHNFNSDGESPVEYYKLEISGPKLMPFIDSLGFSQDRLIYSDQVSPSIESYFNKAVYERGENASPGLYYCGIMNLIVSYCAILNDKKVREAPTIQEQYVLDAIQILHDTSYKLNIKELSQYIGISGKYLSRLFQLEKETTLQQYIITNRMEIAGKLIRSRKYSYKQIADTIGCYDYAAFSRNFNKYYALSPSQYDNVIKENASASENLVDANTQCKSQPSQGALNTTSHSYSDEIPVFDTYDVLVIGGGPSGICAAASAARNGAKTAVIERYGTLGGNLTLGNVGPIMGRVGPGTICREINRMAKTKMPIGRISQSFEELQIDLIKWAADAGVKMIFQCSVGDVVMDGNSIKGVIASTPTGFQIFYGKVIIDATGTGLVSYKAGAQCRFGRDEDGLTQPVTIMFTLSDIDDSKLICENDETYDTRTRNKEFIRNTYAASYSGMLPEGVQLLRLYRSSRGNECLVNATHMNYINGLNLNDIEKAEIELRQQIPCIIDYLKSNVPGFEKCKLARTSKSLGIRESRRVMGDYILTEDDLRTGRKFPDVVVHGANFFFDVHGMRGGGQQSRELTKPYDIPYRCLLPNGVENLLVVGHCISGTHLAHSSYRVMNIGMAIGQAGGIAAAAAVVAGVTPRGLPYQTVQEWLSKAGVDLWCDDDALGYGNVKTAPREYDPN